MEIKESESDTFQCKLAPHQTLVLPVQLPAAAADWTDIPDMEGSKH